MNASRLEQRGSNDARLVPLCLGSSHTNSSWCSDAICTTSCRACVRCRILRRCAIKQKTRIHTGIDFGEKVREGHKATGHGMVWSKLLVVIDQSAKRHRTCVSGGVRLYFGSPSSMKLRPTSDCTFRQNV